MNNTSIVHVRNSIIIADYLKCDLLTHITDIPKYADKKYDVIICAYSSPYMKYNAYLTILQNNPQAKMFWLVNDHDCEDNILLRKWSLWSNQPYNMLCNNPREGYRGWILRKKMNAKTLNDWISEWYTINLNTIIFDEGQFERTKTSSERAGAVYYGTFRKHRINDMLDYNNVGYFLSTSKKNQDKYTEAGITAKFIERISWDNVESTESTLEDFFDASPEVSRLDNFKYSLYFEDVHTHDNYAFMANRFYEGVMNNTLMFYDARCKVTLEKSGYIIDQYQIVNSGDELLTKMKALDSDKKSYKNLLAVQQSNAAIIMKEKIETLEAIKKAIS
jgi:hypothetical protein